MVGTMTIITTFISPYFIKYGWKFTERFVKGQVKIKEINNSKNHLIQIKIGYYANFLTIFESKINL
jgi:hypothetical protein